MVMNLFRGKKVDWRGHQPRAKYAISEPKYLPSLFADIYFKDCDFFSFR
jgi:hypothetical protein